MKRLIYLTIVLLFANFVSGELVSLNVGLLDISKQAHPGDEVFAEISLINIALNKEDVTIEYYIIDKNENIINTESETVLMTTRISRIRSLELPENIRSGRHHFVVKVIYKDKVIGKAIDAFEVIEVEKPYDIEKDVMPYILIILIFFFIFFMIYEYIRFRQIEKLIKKVNERNMKKCLK